MTDAISSLPTGTYPLVFGATAKHALAGGEGGDIVSMRYSFKPASVTQRTTGAVEQGPSGRVVSFDTNNGYQVFDIREETAKSRECVLVWDSERECYVLHALPTTWHLTQNRTLSAQRADGPFARPPSPPPAAPAKRKPAQTGALPSAATVDVPKRAKKAAKPKKTAAPKAAPAPKPAAAPKLPTTKKAAAPKKAPAKKGAAKGKPATPSKVKSAEYIEDSSPEPEPTSEMQDDGGLDGMDDMDEFEDMLGKAMEEENEEDDEEEFEEDEDDELGGAQLGAGGYANDDVEYI